MSSGLFKNVIYKLFFLQIIYLIYMYEPTLNNLYAIKPNQPNQPNYWY